MAQKIDILGMVQTKNHGVVPVLDIPMADDEKEVEIIAECKRKHPEFYTPEHLAECRKFVLQFQKNSHKSHHICDIV